MREKRNTYGILVLKREGKNLLAKPRRTWKDSIIMDLREIGRGCVDWIHPSQDRDWWWDLVNTVMNFRVP
jgi:hypothetical protein